ncbi:2'-5' RNA ligase family protein [Acuticoccus sp. M5D2P5]|nr:2'-5' RNA ligase family protein [Acuticoccus kalidii]
MREPAPIIVTLQLDAATAARFEAERRAHFPPAINRVGAHLTLFHALPGSEETRVMDMIGRAAQRAPFPLAVEGLMRLGRGVAYRIASPDLVGLRGRLAEAFHPVLTPQDRERFRPHVTIQNKVTPEIARETHARLCATFEPFTARAEGLQLWHYRGGPWSPLGAVPFAVSPVRR